MHKQSYSETQAHAALPKVGGSETENHGDWRILEQSKDSCVITVYPRVWNCAGGRASKICPPVL